MINNLFLNYQVDIIIACKILVTIKNNYFSALTLTVPVVLIAPSSMRAEMQYLLESGNYADVTVITNNKKQPFNL